MDRMDGNASRAWKKQVSAMADADELLQEAVELYARQMMVLQVELDEAWDELQATVQEYKQEAERGAVLLGEIVAVVEDRHDEKGSWTGGRVAWVREMMELRDSLAQSAHTEDERPQLDTDGTIVSQLLAEECAELPTGVAEGGGT